MVKEYRDQLNITKEEWLEMLENPEVFREADLQLIKTILDNRGMMSGSEAAEKIGAKNHGVLNLQVGRLSKRIMNFLPEVEYPKNDQGSTRYWHIPFLGEDHPQKNRYYWELREELEKAADTYFYSHSKAVTNSVFSLPENIPAIRLLPMSEKDPAFAGKSLEEVLSWFKFYLPNNIYQFKRKMGTPEGTLVLFQYQGRLIASAILEGTVSYDEMNPYGYTGYYQFSSHTIAVFDPLSFSEVHGVWNELKSFNQSFQKLDPEKYSAFKELLTSRNFRRVVYKDEEDFQHVIEISEAGNTEVKDEPKELIVKVSKASEKLKWGRDPAIAKRAIVSAGYKCESDASHEFFISATTNKNYVEGHHLIPLEFQYEFKNSLDVEANIISLCAMCHKKIHHAQKSEKDSMVEDLYEKRKSRLQKCELEVSLADLKGFY